MHFALLLLLCPRYLNVVSTIQQCPFEPSQQVQGFSCGLPAREVCTAEILWCLRDRDG